MKAQEKQIEILNDLIKINHDRIEGYRKAIEDVKPEDSEIIATFRNMMAQSNKYLSELTSEVRTLGGKAIDNTTMPGKIYHVWMDLKAAFNNDKKSILELCEFGEDAALKSYEMALAADEDLGSNIKQLISKQKQELRESHDLIKSLRDHETIHH